MMYQSRRRTPSLGILRSTRTRSAVRTGHGPQVMATVRNTIVGVLRLAGHDNVTAALRHHSRNPHRPVGLLHEA